MSSAEINGEKVSSSIQNILTSADESVDSAKTLKKLDAIRVGYRHKNKTGGSLYDMEQQISAQKQRLDKARDATLSLDEQTQKLAVARKELEVLKRDLEYQENLLTEFNKINIIKRFEECKEKETELARLTKTSEELVAEVFANGFLPTRQHLVELDFSIKSLEAAQTRLDERQKNIDEIGGECDERAYELAKKAEERGGAAAILADVERKKKQSKKGVVTTVILAAVSAIASGAGVAVALLLGIVWAYAALASLALPLISAIIGAKKKKSLMTQINAIAAEYDTTPDGLGEKLDACAKALLLYRERSVTIARAEAEIGEAKRTLESAVAEVTRLLERTSANIEPTPEAARGELYRLARGLKEYEAIMGEKQTLERLIAAQREDLCHYDEQTLRSEISIDISSVTPTAIAEAERARKFLIPKKNTLEQRISNLNDYVIGLRANAADPLPMADELAELERKYLADSEFYDALTLAIESIEQASKAMSGNVMPTIVSQASDIMSRVSQEKYTTLRATSSFGVSLDSDGFGIKSDFLSGGTKDCAYLALRIALFMKIFGANLPPLVLDEALCQFDDGRAARMLEYLCDISQSDIQCILFTSHKRESEICDELGESYNLISL